MTREDLELYQKYKEKFEAIESVSRKALCELETMWRDGFIDEAKLEQFLNKNKELCADRIASEDNPFNYIGKIFNV